MMSETRWHMGRPKKNDDERRTLRVMVRLNAGELGRVNAQAVQMGVSPSTWLRIVGLRQAPRPTAK